MPDTFLFTSHLMDNRTHPKKQKKNSLKRKPQNQPTTNNKNIQEKAGRCSYQRAYTTVQKTKQKKSEG